MSRSNRYFALFGLPLLVLVGGGLSWRWYATTRADYLLSHGRMAVRHGEWDKVDYFLKQLEDRGYTQPVHLLLGEALLYKGRILLARASGSFDSRLTQPGLTISVPASCRAGMANREAESRSWQKTPDCMSRVASRIG